MLSYKNWKSLNESLFNQTLGLSNHQNLGLVGPSSLYDPVHSEAKAKKEVIEDESGDGETVPASSEKDEPKMSKCKYCGKYSKKMKKEDMDYEDEDNEDEESVEDDENDGDEESMEGDEDDGDEESMEGDEDDGDEESVEGDEDDEYEGDEDEFEESKKHKKHMKHMKCMKCMKESSFNESKKSTSKKKKKKSVSKKDVDASEKASEDASEDGSKDSEASIISKLMKKGLPEKLAIAVAKKKMKKIKNESSWMEGVFGINPTQKFYDGIS